MQVRPRKHGDTCQHRRGLDAAAKPIKCPASATMRLDDIPYCDTHAEPIMAVVCERPVKIRRTGVGG